MGLFRQFHNSGNTQNFYNSLSKNKSFIFYKFLYVAIETLFSKTESSLLYPFNEMGKCVETSKIVLLDGSYTLHCSAQWRFLQHCSRIKASKTLLNVRHINITLYSENEIITLSLSIWSSQQRPKAWPRHQYVCVNVCMFVTLSDTNTHLISTACIPLDVF